MRSLTLLLILAAAGSGSATAQQDPSLISQLNQKLLAKQKSAIPYQTTPTVTPPAAPVPVD